MDDFGIRPLSARSLVLSVLLGLPTPRLAATSPARLAELFGIAAGTMRTAISRMVAAGELATVDGGYELRGRLVERKVAQDIGRRPAVDGWDGTWWVLTVTSPSRDLPARRDFRTTMANARMGELRPDTWLRPANLGDPPPASGTIAVRGHLVGDDDATVAARLWDLPEIRRRCTELLAVVDHGIAELTESPEDRLAGGIMLAAAVVSFLRAEPLLPRTLTPQDWPVDALRDRYAVYDRTLGRALRRSLGQPP